MAASALRIADAGPAVDSGDGLRHRPAGGALLVAAAMGQPHIAVTSSAPSLIIGGLLVGFGTRLGNGCTSGHGVCGLARLSRRSIGATATFMAAGIVTVFVVRQHSLEVLG